MKGWKRISTPRLIIQIIWLVFANSMLLGVPSFGTSPTLRNIYFPDATTKFFQYAPTYSIVYKIQDTLEGGFKSMYMDLALPLLIFVVLILPLGRVWCAWLCPLGLPQDLLSKLRHRLKIPYYEVPPSANWFLHQLKYVALFLIIFYTLSLGAPGLGLSHFRSSLAIPYEQLDPNRAFYVYLQEAVGLVSTSTVVPILSILTTIFFLACSLKIRRFWCRLCPAGAMMAPFNKLASMHLAKDVSKCTGCRTCYRVCPMGIREVYEERKRERVTALECVHCYRCVESCPEDGCLKVTFFKKEIVRSKYPSDMPALIKQPAGA